MLGWCQQLRQKIALGQLGGIAAGLLGKLQQMFKHGQELRVAPFLAFAPTWHADLHAMFDARFLLMRHSAAPVIPTGACSVPGSSTPALMPVLAWN